MVAVPVQVMHHRLRFGVAQVHPEQPSTLLQFASTDQPVPGLVKQFKRLVQVHALVAGGTQHLGKGEGNIDNSDNSDNMDNIDNINNIDNKGNKGYKGITKVSVVSGVGVQ